MNNLDKLIAEARDLSAPRGPQGPAGRDGKDGAPGRDGVDADAAAVATIVLAALQDAPREIGEADLGAIRREVERAVGALRLKSGKPGPRGPRGECGPQGKTGGAPEHEWSGTKLRFRHPDGEWGDYTDLRGPRGHMGPGGVECAEPAPRVFNYFPSWPGGSY